MVEKLFKWQWSQGGDGCSTMKTMTLSSVLTVSPPRIRIINCTLPLIWSRHFFRLASHTGKDATVLISLPSMMVDCHEDSVLKTFTLPTTASDVGEVLSSLLATERLQRQRCLLNLLSNAHFLAGQGLVFRVEGSDSNFMQLINLGSGDNARPVDWSKQ